MHSQVTGAVAESSADATVTDNAANAFAVSALAILWSCLCTANLLGQACIKDQCENIPLIEL